MEILLTFLTTMTCHYVMQQLHFRKTICNHQQCRYKLLVILLVNELRKLHFIV